MVATGKQAWFALMNRKTRTAASRSRGRTRPRLLRGCHAPHGAGDLAPQPDEFVTLGGRQARGGLFPAALLLVGLGDPVADRLRGGLELSGKVLWRASGTDQLDHLTAKLR